MSARPKKVRTEVATRKKVAMAGHTPKLNTQAKGVTTRVGVQGHMKVGTSRRPASTVARKKAMEAALRKVDMGDRKRAMTSLKAMEGNELTHLCCPSLCSVLSNIQHDMSSAAMTCSRATESHS